MILMMMAVVDSLPFVVMLNVKIVIVPFVDGVRARMKKRYCKVRNLYEKKNVWPL